jgi:rusticyanin
MMSGYYGSGGGGMMGGSSYGWMMSRAGYQWMTGGTGAPGWMRGQGLPAFMMRGAAGTDPGTVMGTLFANAPGPRVSPAQATALGSQVPAGASIDQAARTISFTAVNVNLVVLASPSMPAESFRIAVMTDPAFSVPAGAHVTIELINADEDMAHGLVITSAGSARSWMPMMAATPAFPGSALWFLGKPTAAGMHAGTLTFTAGTPGSYQYLCPVPGHAQEGMAGTFTVRLSPAPGYLRDIVRLCTLDPGKAASRNAFRAGDVSTARCSLWARLGTGRLVRVWLLAGAGCRWRAAPR